MKLFASLALVAGLALTSAPAFADEIDGAKLMKQTCFSCHSFGKGERAKTGPNLYGIAGTAAASKSDFTRYSKDLKTAATKGLTWTDENLTAYITDPSAFLKTASGNDKARSTMVFKKLSPDEVAAIVAQLKTMK